MLIFIVFLSGKGDGGRRENQCWRTTSIIPRSLKHYASPLLKQVYLAQLIALSLTLYLPFVFVIASCARVMGVLNHVDVDDDVVIVKEQGERWCVLSTLFKIRYQSLHPTFSSNVCVWRLYVVYLCRGTFGGFWRIFGFMTFLCVCWISRRWIDVYFRPSCNNPLWLTGLKAPTN